MCAGLGHPGYVQVQARPNELRLGSARRSTVAVEIEKRTARCVSPHEDLSAAAPRNPRLGLDAPKSWPSVAGVHHRPPTSSTRPDCVRRAGLRRGFHRVPARWARRHRVDGGEPARRRSGRAERRSPDRRGRGRSLGRAPTIVVASLSVGFKPDRWPARHARPGRSWSGTWRGTSGGASSPRRCRPRRVT